MKRTLFAVAVIAAAVAVAGCEPIESTGSGPTSAPQTQNEPDVVEEEPSEEPVEEEPPAPTMTKAQEQAVGSAQDYLDFSAFSRQGLIDQLSSEYGEGFKKKDAIWAVDYLDVNWKKQAALSAESYLEFQHYSCNGLIDQLESEYGEGFTHAEAVYGAKKTGIC